MIPGPDESLSLLMGAQAISDAELRDLEVEIVERMGPEVRGLLVPDRNLARYRHLIRAELTAGYWNETVGQREIFFQFKLPGGSLEELAYSPETSARISQLCARLNHEPIGKTADLLRYLSGSPFYRDAMIRFYGVSNA